MPLLRHAMPYAILDFISDAYAAFRRYARCAAADYADILLRDAADAIIPSAFTSRCYDAYAS